MPSTLISESIGYISPKTRPATFPVRRVFTVHVYSFGGKSYFRVRDLAILLDAGQPSALAAKIRKKLGNVLLSGSATELFRAQEDSSRTPFISAESLAAFIKDTPFQEVKQALQFYL